jgi:hypothetical protein
MHLMRNNIALAAMELAALVLVAVLAPTWAQDSATAPANGSSGTLAAASSNCSLAPAAAVGAASPIASIPDTFVESTPLAAPGAVGSPAQQPPPQPARPLVTLPQTAAAAAGLPLQQPAAANQAVFRLTPETDGGVNVQQVPPENGSAANDNTNNPATLVGSGAPGPAPAPAPAATTTVPATAVPDAAAATAAAAAADATWAAARAAALSATPRGASALRAADLDRMDDLEARYAKTKAWLQALDARGAAAAALSKAGPQAAAPAAQGEPHGWEAGTRCDSRRQPPAQRQRPT